MRYREVLAVLLGSVLAAPDALACTLGAPIPTPSDLVNSSEVIVWARARAISLEAGERVGPARDRSKIEFAVVVVLKGRVGSPTVTFNGHFEERGDPNDHDAPYEFVRPGGRKGNCHALGYRRGAEYLFLLRRTETGELTPYWSPLAPTNEEVVGPDDPWIQWVREQVSH